MPRRSHATALILGVAVLLGAAPAPAAAWTSGACPTGDGVTVVVDFTAFGSGVVVRCAPGDPGTGLEVLVAAGLNVELVHSMPGFVCRIDGLPGAASESCATTPPISASWSYWHAARGGSWAYNVVGAGASKPAPGSVEGWAFTTGPGAASPPSMPPPPPPADPTPAPTAVVTPRPTAKPTAAPTPVAAAPTAMPTVTASPAATASLTASATPSASPSSPSAMPTPTPTAAEAPIADVRSADSSPPIGTVAGIGLALAVGGAAVAVQRRRRLGPSG